MILVDERTAVMEAKDFGDLLDYSCSLPSGKTIGKRWKKRRVYDDESQGWRMGEYVEDPDPRYVGILWRNIVLVADGRPCRSANHE